MNFCANSNEFHIVHLIILHNDKLETTWYMSVVDIHSSLELIKIE